MRLESKATSVEVQTPRTSHWIRSILLATIPLVHQSRTPRLPLVLAGQVVARSKTVSGALVLFGIRILSDQTYQAATAWDIDSMYTAAASFPSKVATIPQKTFAILTKYSANTSFKNSKFGHVKPFN